MDPPEAWPAKSEATFSYEVGAKLLNLRSGNDNEDEDDIMRSSHAYHESMTQDCIEWDESKHNVDLRKLADPTFETPGIGDETPVHRAEIRSRPLRQSLEAVTRHLQSDCDDDSSTVQDIDEIFYQLSNGNGDDTDALIPRQRNSNAMLQQRPTSSSSTARDVFAVAGSHKRQRRENQKHVNLRKPLASIPEQHEVPPQLNVVTASKPPTDGSTDFDELLQQMQTSRDGNDPSPVAQAAVIPQAESHRSHAHLTDNNIPARPATVKHIEAPLLKHRPIRNAYRYQASSSTSGQNLSSSTNDFARLLDSTTRDAGNAHAAQTGQSRPVATVPAAQKAIAAPTDTATANDNDEFGDMDFCLDDFAKMDSILIAASTQHQSSQSQMVSYNFHSQQQKGNTQLHQVGSSPMNVSVTKGKNPIPEAKASNNDEMDDSFGDIPDIDIDALVLANKSGPLPLSPSRPVQQQSLQLNLQCTFEKRSATRTTESKDPSDFNTKENDLYLDLPDFNIDELIKQTEFNRSQKDDIEPAVHVSLAKESVVNVELQDEFPYIDFDLLDKAVTECSALSQQPRQTAVPPAHAVVRNPRRFASTNSDNRSFLTFSRYKVIRVDVDSTFTKTLTLACWSSDMLEEEEKSSQAIHHQSERRVQDPNRAWPTAGVVHLRGEWFHTRATDGDVLHIVSLTGQFRTDILPLILHTCPPHGSDSDDLVLVVHPDLLLTPTAISETLSCTRKAILKNRLGSTGLTSKAALFGTMRHSLFEETMKEQDFTVKSAIAHIRKIVKQSSEGLLSCDVPSREAEKEILKFLPQLQRFANDYTEFGHVIKPRTLSHSAVFESHGNASHTQFVAKSVEAIEEPFICPELGLKGNVDMLVHAVTAKLDPLLGQLTATSTMSVELKTGHHQHPHNVHIAQLALYVVMLQTRYGRADSKSDEGSAADSGLLLYINNEAVRAVHIVPMLSEIKSLIGMRNVFAIESNRASRPRGIRLSYEEDGESHKVITRVDLLDAVPVELPELLPNSYSCKKCFSNRECMMYAAASRASLKITGPDLTHQELLHHFTGHLVDEEYSYFVHWDRLIDLEADASGSLVARAWLRESDDLEADTSKSVSSLVFDPAVSSPDAVFDESWFSRIGFKRSPTSRIQTPLSTIGLEPGCRVIVSADSTSLLHSSFSNSRHSNVVRPQMHIMRSVVHNVDDTHLRLLASRDDLTRIENIVKAAPLQRIMFRLDRDDSATGIGMLRQNIVNLFTGDMRSPEEPNSKIEQSRLTWLRDVLIRLRKPVYDNSLVKSMFAPNTRTTVCTVPGCDLMDLFFEFTTLNFDQQTAAEQVIAANDYALIQGLPGTGKTSTIAFVARLLAARGKRVLITSYTHAAVDNVLLKLIEFGVASCDANSPLPAILRIGRKASCHPQVHPVLATTVAAQLEVDAGSAPDDFAMPSAESLKRSVSAARIVGVTALTVPRSPLLLGEHFDVVIVDEAGQISQPAIIGALMAADSFVLVGDHMQLPPLVVSELAGIGDFGVSMLKRLAEKHTDSVTQLTYQYRMHKDICQLSNDIVYNGKLKCANDAVAKIRLALSGFPENLPGTVNQNSDAWLNHAIDPRVAVVFLDTDKIKTASCNAPTDIIHPLERSSGRQAGGSIVNDTEASIVRIAVGGLLACGMEASSIGVICPFRAQLRLLEECSSLSLWKRAGLELSTIDRYQGRDKSAIILSFVRSNNKGKVGRLLEDFRRLNVAVTRAKCKLIMIGSYSTLYTGSDILKSILKRVHSNGGTLQLPANATYCYAI